jgi:hypothetical protein
VLLAHETPLIDFEASMWAAELNHAPPLKIWAYPELSTAAQNDVVGHEIARSCLVESIFVAVQLVPLYWRAFPALSTAMQKVDVGHEMPHRTCPLSIVVVDDHVDPL